MLNLMDEKIFMSYQFHARKLCISQALISHRIGGNRKTLLTIDERGSKIARNSVFIAIWATNA